MKADGDRIPVASSMGGGWEFRRDLLEVLDTFISTDDDRDASLGNCFGKTELRLWAEND